LKLGSRASRRIGACTRKISESACLVVAAAFRHHSTDGSPPPASAGQIPRPVPCRRNRTRRSAIELNPSSDGLTSLDVACSTQLSKSFFIRQLTDPPLGGLGRHFPRPHLGRGQLFCRLTLSAINLSELSSILRNRSPLVKGARKQILVNRSPRPRLLSVCRKAT
jgi:hypothetical protein